MNTWKPGRFGPLTIATLCLLTLSLACPAALLAQDNEPGGLPKADEVIKKVLDKMGGEKAWDAVKTMTQEGEMDMGAMGMKATMVVHFHKDGRYVVDVDLVGMGKQREGYDGKVMWEMAPMQAPRIVKGDEKKQKLRMQRMNPFSDLKKFYKSWVTEGTAKVGEKDCIKLKLTPKIGKPEFHYVDKSTWLIARTTMTVPSAMGEMEAIADIKEYKPVGKFLLPSKQSLNMGGMMQMSLKFTSIKLDVKLPEDAFDLPDGIKRLVEKSAGESSKPATRKSG